MTASPEDLLQESGTVVTTTPPSRSGALLKCYDSAEFVDMPIKPRPFVLQPVLRSGSLAMLAAFRGVGKTQVAIGIAHAVATGTSFLHWRAPTPRPVLHVDGEMPGADLQERLKMYPPANPGMLRVIPMDIQEPGVGLNLADLESQERIERLLGHSELLILDNRSTLVSGGRENEAESWDRMQAWLLKLRRKGIAVLLVEHEGRAGNPRGTSKREDVLDTLVQLKRPSDYRVSDGARFEIHFGKARGIFGKDAEPFEAVLKVSDGTAIWTTKPVSVVDLRNRVAELKGTGQSLREIAMTLGTSKSTVQRLLQCQGQQ